MSRSISSSLSRRRFLMQTTGAVAGVAVASSLWHAAVAQESTPAATPASGEWTFTDDRGITVTLPKRPERVFADINAAAPLWDFGIKPIGVTGWAATTDVAWGNLDRSTEVIGDGSELDIERLIAMQPDIYVNITWRPDIQDASWGIGDAEGVARVNEIVPIVCISATGSADVNTARFAELAGLLGADLESPELSAAKAAYDASVLAFSEIAAEKSDLSSLFAYVGAIDNWYAASTQAWADLAFYEKLGLNVVAVSPGEGGYWEDLSREQALKYPSDVFFNSTREGMLDAEGLQADPVFGSHPAVASGQIGAWNQDFIMSYEGLTSALDNMTATLAAATKLT